MLRLVSAFSRVSVVGVGLGVLSLQGSVRGQLAAHGEFDRDTAVVRGNGAIDEVATPEIAATVIVGRVLGPDGAPAVGAVVVTSAGGQAVTDAEGAFSLELGVPADAESVHVTAVLGSGTGSLVGSAQVGGLVPWGTTSAGTLILAAASTCEPSWLPTFGGATGVNGTVYAFAVFDDGSGPALYAGGGFTTAGGVAAPYIAKWDGSSWSALGSGMEFWVSAIAVYDDDGGPALYAGGYFTTAGGVAANKIAKWNGSSWSALGSGMSKGLYFASVSALTVFDDGSGPALYAGGSFTRAGDVPANNIAKWNGTSWSALGSGTDSDVIALTVFDDGSGPALYVGGFFPTAGGVAANSIAKWNGSTWSALGSGLAYGFDPGSVGALTVFNYGSGPALYAGGYFTAAGGVAANSIAKWNGSTWSALGSGLAYGFDPGSVGALAVFDDGSGPALYAGGGFTDAGGVLANSIAEWNGASWSALGSGMNSGVEALTVFDDGSGPALYAGGYFLTSPAGDSFLAKWGGCSATASPWTNLGSSLPGVSGAPLLEGSGTMEAGSQNILDLSNAAPSAVAILFAAPSSLPTPFKGGIVLPDPIYPPTYGMTDAAGAIRFRFLLPVGMPSGSQAWIQWGIQDAAAAQGVSLSNAVEGVTP